MFIIHICVTNTMLGIVTWFVKRIAEKFPSRYGAVIIRQHTNLTFYSFFEKIVGK